MARYGDKPTLALAWNLSVSDLVKESGFKVFLEQLQQEVQSKSCQFLAAMMRSNVPGK